MPFYPPGRAEYLLAPSIFYWAYLVALHVFVFILIWWAPVSVLVSSSLSIFLILCFSWYYWRRSQSLLVCLSQANDGWYLTWPNYSLGPVDLVHYMILPGCVVLRFADLQQSQSKIQVLWADQLPVEQYRQFLVILKFKPNVVSH